MTNDDAPVMTSEEFQRSISGEFYPGQGIHKFIGDKPGDHSGACQTCGIGWSSNYHMAPHRERPTPEQSVFDLFRFGLGQLVYHRADGIVGLVSNRILVQAPTGNTGHMYVVSHGDRYIRRFEIELDPLHITGTILDGLETGEINDGDPMNGLGIIFLERDRQILYEGFKADRDDAYLDGELVWAGNSYRMLAENPDRDQDNETLPQTWPIDWDIKWWKPTNRIRNFVKAGALYQAEIDRLIRLRNKVADAIDKELKVDNSQKEVE